MHRFNGHAGKTFITIVRSVLNEDLFAVFGGLFESWFAGGGLNGELPTPEETERVTNIVNGLINRAKNENITNGKYNGNTIDIVIGILVDLLTDYVPGTSIPLFYENLGEALDGALDDAEAIIAKYGIESTGYTGWELDAEGNKVVKDAEGNVLFTQAEVNETMDSLDIVIQKALPDVLNILTSTGTLDLSKLGIELDTTSEDGSAVSLFDIVASLVGDMVFTDKMMTTIYDLLMGIFGGGIGNFRDVAKEAGFDFTAKTLYLSDETEAGLKAYMNYNLTIDTNGQVNGEDLTWQMIKEAHEITSYKYDENGNVVLNADGTAKGDYAQIHATDADGKYIYVDESGTEYVEDTTGITEIEVLDGVTVKVEPKMVDDLDNPKTEYVSVYTQKTNDAGEYLYTYTNADGETVEYTSTIANLKSYAVKTGTKEVENEDGSTETVDVYAKYTLTPSYDETTAKWTFGFQAGNDHFYTNISVFVGALWDFIAQFEDILVALFFGETTNTAVKAFDILNIEGQDTYENTILPLLRGFGLDAILTYLEALNDKRANKYGTSQIPNRLIKNNAGMLQAMGGEYNMEKFLTVIVNYVFFFVEVLAEYPIATLANMLPTLAYFITGDGLNEILSNLLTFVMVFIDRLDPLLDIDVNDLGAGLIDMLGTKTWTSFQEIFLNYATKTEFVYDGKTYPAGTKAYDVVTYDEDGKPVVTTYPAEVKNISFTEALVSFLANIKIDMAKIYKKEGVYERTITAFIDADVENAAWDIINANTVNGVTDEEKLEEARQMRSAAVSAWLESVAALADPFGASYTDADNVTHNIPSEYQNLVKVDAANGQLTVPKADVLMFLIDFIFANTTLKEVLGSVLGYDITDENGTDAEMLDELLTGVFRNPDQVVDLIVTLFTD